MCSSFPALIFFCLLALIQLHVYSSLKDACLLMRERHLKMDTFFLSEKVQATFQTAQSDCQMASSELSRLQSQYSDLIRQFEQTQKVVDQQRVSWISFGLFLDVLMTK